LEFFLKLIYLLPNNQQAPLRVVATKKKEDFFFFLRFHVATTKFLFLAFLLAEEKKHTKEKNMCGKALGYNGKAKEKKCAKKKACGNGKALVDMAKAHCYQSREL
jgi:hypothetical protein